MRKPIIGDSDQADTNRAAQLQKIARGFKFRIKEEEELHYQCSENKGADQLCGYREADLHLCFRICKSRFSHNAAHMMQTRGLKLWMEKLHIR